MFEVKVLMIEFIGKSNLELSQLLELLDFLLREAPPLMGDTSDPSICNKDMTVAHAELLRDVLSHCMHMHFQGWHGTNITCAAPSFLHR